MLLSRQFPSLEADRQKKTLLTLFGERHIFPPIDRDMSLPLPQAAPLAAKAEIVVAFSLDSTTRG